MDEDVTHHLELDACVLTLKDQDTALALFESHGMPLMPLTLSKAELKQGQVRRPAASHPTCLASCYPTCTHSFSDTRETPRFPCLLDWNNL
jgi:hypothetical protein